jgi:hypothetical protein
MNKLVKITAMFKDRESLSACAPVPGTVKFAYDKDGLPLTEKDSKKAEKVTEHYLNSHTYPVFLPVDDIKDDAPFVAEAWLNLNLWTNTGLPRFTMKDIRTGKVLTVATGNGGGRPRKTSLKTS